MKQLSRDQKKQRDELVAALNAKASALGEAWASFEAAHEHLALAVDQYNGAVGDAETFRDDIAQEMQDYWDERSERWQEGEAGLAYEAWIDAWTGADLEMIDCPELPDEPETAHADALDELPEEVE